MAPEGFLEEEALVGHPLGPEGLAEEVGTQPPQSEQQQFQEGLAEVTASCSPGMRPSQSCKNTPHAAQNSPYCLGLRLGESRRLPKGGWSWRWGSRRRSSSTSLYGAGSVFAKTFPLAPAGRPALWKGWGSCLDCCVSNVQRRGSLAGGGLPERAGCPSGGAPSCPRDMCALAHGGPPPWAGLAGSPVPGLLAPSPALAISGTGCVQGWGGMGNPAQTEDAGGTPWTSVPGSRIFDHWSLCPWPQPQRVSGLGWDAGPTVKGKEGCQITDKPLPSGNSWSQYLE